MQSFTSGSPLTDARHFHKPHLTPTNVITILDAHNPTASPDVQSSLVDRPHNPTASPDVLSSLLWIDHTILQPSLMYKALVDRLHNPTASPDVQSSLLWIYHRIL